MVLRDHYGRLALSKEGVADVEGSPWLRVQVNPASDAGRGVAVHLASFAIDNERAADTDLNPTVVGVRDVTMRRSEG